MGNPKAMMGRYERSTLRVPRSDALSNYEPD